MAVAIRTSVKSERTEFRTLIGISGFSEERFASAGARKVTARFIEATAHSSKNPRLAYSAAVQPSGTMFPKAETKYPSWETKNRK